MTNIQNQKGEIIVGQNNQQLLNQVIWADCLVAMEHIENNSIDMILCDLPYG